MAENFIPLLQPAGGKFSNNHRMRPNLAGTKERLQTRLARALFAGEIHPPEAGRDDSTAAFNIKACELVLG